MRSTINADAQRKRALYALQATSVSMSTVNWSQFCYAIACAHLFIWDDEHADAYRVFNEASGIVWG